ncbi:hypothetical protein IL252_16955 [Halomicrobium sp. IBSBa]|uniref:hypothetical protein n=1 Tax=Halomicrobium sp. IBSBa TaxID=2778916 RepID=UPI001ABF8864|nr:hypothetical protein [Halomicrobium sp. IBSBa]MBO4249498.1 hypothetical protein [Halomicrobium sp. IBSBa]
MARITNLSDNNGTGTVSLPKDELEMCDLLNESGLPDSDVQLMVMMEAPGEWRVSVLDDSDVDDSWYTGETPDTGVNVNNANSTSR